MQRVRYTVGVRPTCPAVSRVLAERELPSASVVLAPLQGPGEKRARLAEGGLVYGTADPYVARPVPVPGWDGPAAWTALVRAFPACEAFEVGYYVLFLCPRRSP